MRSELWISKRCANDRYHKVTSSRLVHRGAFCQFPFCISKSTGKETRKMHLCAVYYSTFEQFWAATNWDALLRETWSCLQHEKIIYRLSEIDSTAVIPLLWKELKWSQLMLASVRIWKANPTLFLSNFWRELFSGFINTDWVPKKDSANESDAFLWFAYVENMSKIATFLGRFWIFG